MERLSLKKVIMQKNANAVIYGWLFVSDSFKISLPLVIKGLLVGFSYKNTVWQKTVGEALTTVLEARLCKPLEDTHQSALKRKKSHKRGPV